MAKNMFLLNCVLISMMIAISENKKSSSPVCSKSCPGSATSGTEMATFCTKNSLKLEGRCCINDTVKDSSQVVGVDLHNCSLTESSLKDSIQGLEGLKYLLVEGNSLQNLTSSDLEDCTCLLYLSLPTGLSCPGGPEAWTMEVKRSSTVECKDQVDICESRNVTCPENSHCVHSSFDDSQCQCNEGFYGYKCMNKGTFPLVPFFAGLIVPSVVIYILLWFTQRKYVVAQKKK